MTLIHNGPPPAKVHFPAAGRPDPAAVSSRDGGVELRVQRGPGRRAGAQLVISVQCPLCLISLLLQGCGSWKRAVTQWKKLRASGGTADALASGASIRKGVGVQIPPRAREKNNPGLVSGYFFTYFLMH